ncbi:unnamed protein product, partial [Staurois parvus]
MVRVTSQGSEQGWSDKPGIRAGSAENQTGTESRNRIQGPREHNTKAESASLA